MELSSCVLERVGKTCCNLFLFGINSGALGERRLGFCKQAGATDLLLAKRRLVLPIWTVGTRGDAVTLTRGFTEFHTTRAVVKQGNMFLKLLRMIARLRTRLWIVVELDTQFVISQEFRWNTMNIGAAVGRRSSTLTISVSTGSWTARFAGHGIHQLLKPRFF